MEVLIGGAGLGGLSAALSLHAAGIEVRVVDAARELTALGVGINILPHATRELVELGLADELAAIGIPTDELIYHDRFGSRICVEPRGLTETEPFLGGRTMILSGFNPVVVAYPVSKDAERRGRSAVNWGVGARLGQPTHAQLGDWHQVGGLDDVLPHVADRCFDWLDVPALVRAAATIWEYPMVDRDPTRRPAGSG